MPSSTWLGSGTVRSSWSTCASPDAACCPTSSPGFRSVASRSPSHRGAARDALAHAAGEDLLLTVDIGCEVGDRLWVTSDEELAMRLEHLAELIPGARRRYLGCRVLRTPIARPVFSGREDDRLALEQGTPVAGCTASPDA